MTTSVRLAAIAPFYVAVTVVLGRDVLGSLATGIAGDLGDPLLTAAILDWNAWTLPLTHAWWQFPIFYPTLDALAFSEHLLGLSVIATPVAWITRDPLVTYNVVTLLTFPLSAIAMFVLVRRLTGSMAGALVAGLAFGFSPYRMSQLSHVQMLAGFWAPLSLLGLHEYLESGRRRWLALYGSMWMLQAAANGYTLFLFSALVGLWVLWFVVARQRWRACAEIGGATLLASVPLVPALYTYAAVLARHGFSRGIVEVQAFSADIAAVFCAAPNLAFWGWLHVACRPEGALFPGATLLVLFVIGLAYVLVWRQREDAGATWRIVTAIRRISLVVAAANAAAVAAVLIFGQWRVDLGFVSASATSIAKPLLVALAALVLALITSRGVWAALRRSSVLGFYVLAAVATWALALGPTIVFMGAPRGYAGPFAWLMWLPGVDTLRAPARFWLMTMLCLAVVSGMVVARLLKGLGGKAAAALVAVVCAGVLGDGWVDRIDVPRAPEPVPNAALLRGGLVLTLPPGEGDIAAVYQAVTGGWTSVNGYSGYEPSYYHAVRIGSRESADELFEPFRSDRDLHVVVPSDAPGLRAFVARQPGAILVGTTGSRAQYRLPMVAAASPTSSSGAVRIQHIDASCSAESASQAVDGDPASLWSCGPQSGREVLTADLGEAAKVNGLRYVLGRAGDFPRRLLVETSLDGSAWQSAWEGHVVAKVISGAFVQTRWPAISFSFPPRPARYVRLRQTGRDEEFHWSVGEIEILRD